ncbi:MAG: serine hydrolase [Myxococcota bacterium]
MIETLAVLAWLFGAPDPTASDPWDAHRSRSSVRDASLAAPRDVPLGVAAAGCVGYYPMRSSDPKLQARLEAGLREGGLWEAARGGRLAVAVVDLTMKGRARYAGVNDDIMFYAASLPKILSLLAMADQADRGALPWNRKVEARLSNMINRSSNADASWAFDRVGLDALEEVVTRPGYCFYGAEHGGLWLGRPFRPGGPTRRDPQFNISHGATARQVARFYTLMDLELFEGETTSQRVKELMGPPELHHKFVRALADRDVTITARKSGTWRAHHADSALVEHRGRRYAVVALAHMKDGSRAVEQIARVADDCVLSTAPTEPRPRR